jgi:hypothetical protein
MRRKGSLEPRSQVCRSSVDVGQSTGVDVKPWRGPLPKAQVTPVVTLGQVMAAWQGN